MRLFAAIVLALAVACGSDSPSEPQTPTVVGTWALSSIDGAGLPYLLDQLGEDKIELMEAAVTTTATRTFTTTSTERTTISGQATSKSYAEDGSYAMNGEVVSFTFTSDGSVVSGTIRGDSLTFTGGGATVVYKRR